jgi:hypothetical protein
MSGSGDDTDLKRCGERNSQASDGFTGTGAFVKGENCPGVKTVRATGVHILCKLFW